MRDALAFDLARDTGEEAAAAEKEARDALQ
jgi:hypothetical protein